ncbi:MAG: hypothetical protein PHD51_02165 [Patescibacteria group bacterium]|nr:hypothetical protein [Patescibacteria group bacterium]MDD5490334.1 hypothetical protein [Patescibacteria group bacterium]
MEKFEKEHPKSRVDEAKDMISGSPEKIEKEFQETANSWLACFGSRVFVIETYLSGKKAEDELGSEKYNAVMEKLETLKQKLYALKRQYPDKSTTPPDKIKQELLEMLDVLK